MNKKDKAISLLQHYFSLSIPEVFDNDCRAEVSDIVEYIIEAVIEEIDTRNEEI